jgi:hypothetical protein
MTTRRALMKPRSARAADQFLGRKGKERKGTARPEVNTDDRCMLGGIGNRWTSTSERTAYGSLF